MVDPQAALILVAVEVVLFEVATILVRSGAGAEVALSPPIAGVELDCVSTGTPPRTHCGAVAALLEGTVTQK